MTPESDIDAALNDTGPPSGASEMEVLRPHLISHHPDFSLDANVDVVPSPATPHRAIPLLIIGLLVILTLGAATAIAALLLLSVAFLMMS